MVVPVGPDGVPVYPAVAAVPYPAAAPYPAPAYTTPPPVVAAPSAPVPNVLQARLYPSNEIASRTGMLSGTVTNLMTGKGQFQLDLAGELLSGEATRVPGNERAGVASAYGSRGTFMNCEYKMTTPYQGTGHMPRVDGRLVSGPHRRLTHAARDRNRDGQRAGISGPLSFGRRGRLAPRRLRSAALGDGARVMRVRSAVLSKAARRHARNRGWPDRPAPSAA